jgi:5-formyltetrahydrofolate cyclo-ligase
MLSRSSLRHSLRARRQALSPSQQQLASTLALEHLQQIPEVIAAQRIALYLANDGELDLGLITQHLWRLGKTTFLPILHPSLEQQLGFVDYTCQTRLSANRFGIAEPDQHQGLSLAPQLLDLVLLPLVGFDRRGGRLGMGGGFYDRTFAFCQHKNTKPYLIGMAHGCQEVAHLTQYAWDIGLHSIVTDQEVIRVKA